MSAELPGRSRARGPGGSARETIAGYPATLTAFDVEADGGRHAARTIELWSVAELDSIVDAGALLRNVDEAEPPYWTLVWIGARAIAARLLDRPPAADTATLDLGCGLGLSGIAAACAGARVTFCDHVPEPLAFVRASARHHAIENARTLELDFTREGLDQRFDLILAADVVYDPTAYAPLVAFLDAQLTDEGTLLLTESLRADARRVLDMLVARGMSVKTEAVWIPEDGRLERTWLHTVRRGAR